MKQPDKFPEHGAERHIIPPRIIGDDDHNQKHLVLAPLNLKEGIIGKSDKFGNL